MGAKTWLLVYSDGVARDILKSKPALDRTATNALVRELFSSEKLELLGDATLADACPPDDEIVAGCFNGLSIIAAKEFGIDYPSRVPAAFLSQRYGKSIYLHAMHSTVDWFAYAVWRDGALMRSLSLSPDSGILEDNGTRLEFEEPYWRGEHSPVDPEEDESEYPFAFHPLELGEAALLEFFGYQLEGIWDPTNTQPEDIPLMRFKRTKAWWKLW